MAYSTDPSAERQPLPCNHSVLIALSADSVCCTECGEPYVNIAAECESVGVAEVRHMRGERGWQ